MQFPGVEYERKNSSTVERNIKKRATAFVRVTGELSGKLSRGNNRVSLLQLHKGSRTSMTILGEVKSGPHAHFIGRGRCRYSI